MDLGPWEIAIIAVVILVLFGSKKMPDAARSLGRSMRIFKSEIKGLHDDDAPSASQPAAQPASQAVTPPAELPAGQPAAGAAAGTPGSIPTTAAVERPDLR